LLRDATSSLGDAKSSLGDAKSSRWVTLRARWVTLRARWVTLIARWATLRARWVTLRAYLLGGELGQLLRRQRRDGLDRQARHLLAREHAERGGVQRLEVRERELGQAVRAVRLGLPQEKPNGAVSWTDSW
jgi:hypothetical protein